MLNIFFVEGGKGGGGGIGHVHKSVLYVDLYVGGTQSFILYIYLKIHNVYANAIVFCLFVNLW